MSELVACLSTGKGTWGHVIRLIESRDWDNIFLLTNEFGRENFKSAKPVNLIVTDSKKPIRELIDDIKNQLKDITVTDVALNLASGTGKEHMALLSALLNLGVGIRLVGITAKGFEEF